MSREQASARRRQEEREEAERRSTLRPKFVLIPGIILSSPEVEYEIHLKNLGATARNVVVSVDGGAKALVVAVFETGAMHTIHRKYTIRPPGGIRMAIHFTDTAGVEGDVYFLGNTSAGGLHFEERDSFAA